MAQDVRGIANYVLKVAHTERQSVSNLSLNKILYFLHVAFLHEFNRPLISAKIEAWDHGPVFREVYHQFKTFGKKPIDCFAKKLDIMSGEYVTAQYSLEKVEEDFLYIHCAQLLKIPVGRLVDMSHVEDGPWSQARFGKGRINPGIEITDDLILAASEGQSRH